MKHRTVVLAAMAVFTTRAAVAQQSISVPEGYYSAPMKIPLLPSANFAETRPNHLHSGVDIKTQGVEGIPVYSVADGYVARIGIAPWGYGRALYIAHPNGTTSVYAHLQKFTPEIEKYINDERYRLKNHNPDVWPAADKFPVKKGSLIGYSGDSGASAGPHLHFEIRETAAQRPVNVLARGYLKMKDDIAPRIVNLYYIEVDTVGVVPVCSKPRLLGVKNISAGKYVLNGVETITIGPRGYFVLEVTDRKNDVSNTMGVYGIDVLLDGQAIYGFRLDGFTFDNTRYVNSLMQFDMQSGNSNQLLRLAVQENNRLPVFKTIKNRGLIMLDDDLARPVEIRASDDNGNVSTLSFNVKRRTVQSQFYTANDVAGTVLDCRRNFRQSFPEMEINIPAGALYESIFYTQSEDQPALPVSGNAKTMTRYSPVYTLHDAKIPLHTAFELSVKPSADVPEHLRPRLCLASVSADNSKYTYAGGKYAAGVVKASLRSFGKYCVVADTIPPRISPSFVAGADLRAAKSIYFTNTDDFSGVASYTATIDGHWIAFEQGKKGLVTHYFDPARVEYKGGKHTLIMTVTDSAGNSTTLTREFLK